MNTSGAIFWTILIGAVVWLVLLFATFRGIAKRNDLTTITKVIWVLIIFMAPVLGLITYFIFGKKVERRP
ncbi:MAG TPA: PLDc N-terminal domain-containing protein [Flavisolibacter sp.]|nr:PLDc N-terminal domain-containing protein [Flavisolibacter sp.]